MEAVSKCTGKQIQVLEYDYYGLKQSPVSGTIHVILGN